MAIWYEQDFDALTPGPLAGQDGWVALSPPFLNNAALEMLKVSSTHPVGTGQSLSCEAGPRPPTPPSSFGSFVSIARSLQTFNDATGYEVNFKFKVVQTGSTLNVFQVRFANTNLLSWLLQIRGDGSVSTVTGNGLGGPKIDSGIMTLSVSTTYNFKIVVDAGSALSLFIYTGSPGSPILTSFAQFPMGDQIQFLLSGTPFVASTFKAALDDLLLEYTVPIIAAPITPKAPINVIVNARNNYAVVSWDGVTDGIVEEIIARGPTGDFEDSLTHTDVSVSPIVLRAIIGGKTVNKETALPQEGRDFNVNKIAGTVTWSTSSLKRPDFDTDYRVRYEVPTDVTGYNVYASNLLNEHDRVLYNVVTGVDSGGAVDTAFVDTDIRSVRAYRVAALGSDVLESILSDKVVAIKAPSQIDDKIEVIDRKLFTLDQSLLDEGILR
jgi:hypothetical protein